QPTPAELRARMGDEVPFSPGGKLVAQFPVSCFIRLLNHGDVVADVTGDRLDHPLAGPGVYRVEGWLELDGELRPWVYSNPIYVR
ncbi:histidinol phosphatase, partial [Singulisphaera rosea]